MKITKPAGTTRTERLLATLCEKTFLKLWSWPTPRKDDGKELCDLIAIFDDHVFIFFDRESKVMRNTGKDVDVTWHRWKKEVIDKQINTAKGAARYIRNRRPIFLDERREQPFPGVISKHPTIHKIIVAHGAEEACIAYSKANVYGSLGIVYENAIPGTEQGPPFFLQLERVEPVHVFDSVNLGIVLGELDTFYDFAAYMTEKESAIAKYNSLAYCGEEDLLAHYFMNLDTRLNSYKIGVDDPLVNVLMIEEGMWRDFLDRGYGDQRRAENKDSYLWDEIIQSTYQYALDGTTSGASVWNHKDALHEMAREPRISRRALSRNIVDSIRSFPPTENKIVRTVSYMYSLLDHSKMYVFLQLRCAQYSIEGCRKLRQHMLEVACGTVRNRFSDLTTVIGIAIDAPRYTSRNSEDFLLLECEHWSHEQRAHYERENEMYGFFKNVRKTERRIVDFE